MQPVDFGRWPRREIFEFFSGISDPFYAVTFRLDVTRLCEHSKARGLSFYHSLIWLHPGAGAGGGLLLRRLGGACGAP